MPKPLNRMLMLFSINFRFHMPSVACEYLSKIKAKVEDSVQRYEEYAYLSIPRNCLFNCYATQYKGDIMQEETLVLLNDKNKEITLNICDIKGLQGYYGVETIDTGNYSHAGSGYEYIKITTISGEHNIIRNCKNDQQILSFMLSKKV